MANEKQIKAKIALNYNTYEHWTTGKGKDYAPLKGEVCFCAIESKAQGAQTAPTVLFKVGVDGQTKFSALKWASALAADVYDWAKVDGANVFTKEGTGNVISGITYDKALNGGKGGFKFATASVATAEGLEELQKEVYGENGSADNSRIDKLEKAIDDNRDAWVLDTDTRYSFSNDGDKLVVKKTLYTNGVAGTEETVCTYEFLTAKEVAETLKGYYTKTGADAKYVTGLAEGATNGTIKAVVNGVNGADVKIHGLQDAAYATVASLNATAKGYADAVEAKLPTSADYGVLEVKGDTTSGVVVDKTDAQRPIVKIAANTYDAHGAASEAEGRINETLKGYYTKTEADAAFTTPAEVISEVNKALSEVSNTDTITNITTLVEYVNENAGDLTGLITEVYGSAEMTGDSRLDTIEAKAAMGITADDIQNWNTTKSTVDTNKATWDKADTALQAADLTEYDEGKKFGDIITHNAAEFATFNQGVNADTALQKIEVGTGLTVSDKSANKQTINIDTDVVFVLDCNW